MSSTASLRQLPDNLVVLNGNHPECDPTNDKSGCVMNLVAWVCGYEEITDTPPCASEVLTKYAIRLNDHIKDDNLRTSLMLPLVTKLAGSKSTEGVELKRMFYLVDKAVRVFAPIALSTRGFTERATTLRNLDPIVDKQTAKSAYAAAAAAADAAAAAAAEIYTLAAKTLERACNIV